MHHIVRLNFRLKLVRLYLFRFFALLSLLGPLGLAYAAEAHDAAIAQARGVMDRFMSSFNDRNVPALADTLLFPHVRVASGGVVVIPDKASFIAGTDMAAFAAANNWQYSAWDDIQVIQAGPDKVHFKVKFSRFNPAGEKNVTYDSLYVVQHVEGRWGIRARSSFAP